MAKNQTHTPEKQPIPLNRRALLGKNWKRRLTLSLLCGFSTPMLLVAGVFELFAANKTEFDFALSDFLTGVILFCVGLGLLLSVVMFFWKRKVFDGIFAFFFGVTLAGFLQATFMNVGVGTLAGDGFGGVNPIWAVGNALVWIAIVAGCMAGVFLISRKVRDTVYAAVVIALVVVLGTQAVSVTTTLLTTDVAEPPATPDGANYILTEADMFEISTKDNVVVFVLDRFDRNYAEYTLKTYPDTFDFLDGFTYYEDNLSLHMRTWPASPTMLTGMDIDFNQENAAEFTKRAYGTSPFLGALKDNGYSIKIYVDDFYSYRDAAVFDGVADNLFKTGAEYTINDPATLTKRMLLMSLYRLSPIATKSSFDLSSGSFAGFVDYAAPDEKYKMNDAYFYDKIKENGVTVQSKDKNFMYVHTGGCHPPYYIDENGNPREEKWADNDENASRAMRGNFLLIKEYIQGMKDAGVYEDATIIITGDHASPVGSEPLKFGDNRLPTEPRLTALFVKRAGEHGTPMKKCDTPVAQCNLIPSIIESAGIETDIDFGQTYWDENLPDVRYYRHALNGKSDKEVTMVKYAVTGDGRDFSHWEIVDRTYIGAIYE